MARYVFAFGNFAINAEFQVSSSLILFGIRSSHGSAEICETDIKRKISLCKELLQVVRVLEPGKSIFRGKLLVDLQDALFAETERRVKNCEMSKLVALVCIHFPVLTTTLNNMWGNR